MARIGATLLALVGILVAGGAAAEDDSRDCRETCPLRVHAECEAAQTEAEAPTRTDATAANEATDAGAQTFDELPIYIPPSRGTTSMRVGGATRGGQRPGVRL